MRSPGTDAEVDPLVGRDREVERLRRALVTRSGVLVTGEAGVGKSYLAHVFAGAATAGRPVLRAVGLAAGRDRPLGALRALTGPSGPARGDAVSAAANELCRTGGDGTLLVDDVDALDGVSTLVLHELASRRRTGTRAPWLLLTMRTGRVLPEAVEALLTDGTLDHLPLRPLDEHASADLLAHLLGGRVDPLTAHELFGRTRGNPLFLRELAAAGHDDDLWARRAAGWTLPVDRTSQDRLLPLVQARLASLDDAARRTGRALALLGPLPADVLHDLAVLPGARRLVAAGLAGEEHGQLGLVHPLYAEALLSDDSDDSPGDSDGAGTDDALLRRALALADLPVAAQVRLAGAAVQRGAVLAPEHLDRAARLALRLDDPDLARELADRAHGLAPTSTRVRLTRARAVAGVGDPEGVDRLVELTQDEDSAVREEAGLTLARLRVAGPDGVRDALEVLAGADSPAAGALRAVAHLRQASWDDGSRAAEQALGAATATEEWLEAAAIRALLLITTDDVPGGLELAQRGIATLRAGALPTPYASLLLAQAATDGALLTGRPELAAELAGTVLPHTGDRRSHAAHRTMRRGYVALHRGRLDEAVRHLEAALPLLAASDPVDIRAWTCGLLGQAQAMRGHLEEAAAAVARGHDVAERGQVTQLTEVVRAEAWLSAARGHPEAASDLLRGLLGGGEDSPVRRSRVLLDLARLGATADAAEGLRGLGPATRSPVVADVERLVLATLDGRSADALAAARSLVDAGLPLWAADLLAVASDADNEHGEQGEHDRPALRRGALLAGLACRGARTPALAGVQALVTPTQRRVARLAADGLSNAEVGRELGISPRTAATHLHRVYKVLGVHDRTELGRLLG